MKIGLPRNGIVSESGCLRTVIGNTGGERERIEATRAAGGEWRMRDYDDPAPGGPIVELHPRVPRVVKMDSRLCSSNLFMLKLSLTISILVIIPA